MARLEAYKPKEIMPGIKTQLGNVARIGYATVIVGAIATVEMTRQRRTRLTRKEKKEATEQAAAKRNASHGSAANALDTGGKVLEVNHEVYQVMKDERRAPKTQPGTSKVPMGGTPRRAED